MEPRKQTIELAGKTLTLETGVMAKQSSGSVTVTYGETVVLCTVNAESQPKKGINYFRYQLNTENVFMLAGKSLVVISREKDGQVKKKSYLPV